MDPQHEVVYYGKLLKLGTLRGKNWGEKWEMVKGQQLRAGTTAQAKDILPKKAPPRPPSQARSISPLPSKAKILTRLTGALKALEKDDDVFTLHSHQDDTESDAVPIDDTIEATPTARPRTRTVTTRRPASPALSAVTNTIDLDDELASALTSTPVAKARRPFSRLPRAWDGETSDATVDTAKASSSKPPSYGAATRETDDAVKTSSYTPLRALARAHTKVPPSASEASTSHVAPAAARAAVLQARERRGSVINEDDAWTKIRMAGDEKEADRFREDRLVERCWEVWKQGYQWIVVCMQSFRMSQVTKMPPLLFSPDHERANLGGER